MSTSAATVTPTVIKEADVWILRLNKPNANGKPQEFRCATEAQARQLALVLNPPEKS
jgi:hypothetical protein